MVSTGALLVFLGVVLVAYVVPGPDWILILRNAARSRRAGFVSAAGVQCGLLVHMAVAAAGVSAILLQSAVAFTVLKVVGGLYLVYLGAQTLWRSRHSAPGGPGATADENAAAENGEPAPGRIFAQSFLANVLNPKAALFFVSVLPQFVDAGLPVAPQVLLLGGIDIALGVVWWAAFVLLAARLGTLIRRPRPRRILDRVSGTALVGLGGAVVAEA